MRGRKGYRRQLIKWTGSGDHRNESNRNAITVWRVIQNVLSAIEKGAGSVSNAKPFSLSMILSTEASL